MAKIVQLKILTDEWIVLLETVRRGPVSFLSTHYFWTNMSCDRDGRQLLFSSKATTSFERSAHEFSRNNNFARMKYLIHRDEKLQKGMNSATIGEDENVKLRSLTA